MPFLTKEEIGRNVLDEEGTFRSESIPEVGLLNAMVEEINIELMMVFVASFIIFVFFLIITHGGIINTGKVIVKKIIKTVFSCWKLVRIFKSTVLLWYRQFIIFCKNVNDEP